MTGQTAAPRRGRGRRAAAEVRAGVLAAAGRRLLQEGLPAVTFDRVAREAGTSKVTLYKWWPSPGALAAEAYFARSAPVLALPDTGDLRADLASQLTARVRLRTREGAGVPGSQIVGAAQPAPHVAAAWVEGYARARRGPGLERLRTAQRSGQLRADADLHLLVDQLWGVCYH